MRLRMPVQHYAVCNSSLREWLSLVGYTLYTLEAVTDKVPEMSLIDYHGIKMVISRKVVRNGGRALLMP